MKATRLVPLSFWQHTMNYFFSMFLTVVKLDCLATLPRRDAQYHRAKSFTNWTGPDILDINIVQRSQCFATWKYVWVKIISVSLFRTLSISITNAAHNFKDFFFFFFDFSNISAWTDFYLVEFHFFFIMGACYESVFRCYPIQLICIQPASHFRRERTCERPGIRCEIVRTRGNREYDEIWTTNSASGRCDMIGICLQEKHPPFMCYGGIGSLGWGA